MFRCVSESTDFSQVISDIFQSIDDDWDKIVKEKINYYQKSDKNLRAIKLFIHQEARNQANVECNREKPIYNQSITDIVGDKWFYFDRFYKSTIEYILTNVLYSSSCIKDPFKDSRTSIEEAHMWWRIRNADEDDNFIVFETANATENIEIKLGKHSTIACIERTGGRIDTYVDKQKAIAYTRLYIPKFNYFLRKIK